MALCNSTLAARLARPPEARPTQHTANMVREQSDALGALQPPGQGLGSDPGRSREQCGGQRRHRRACLHDDRVA